MEEATVYHKIWEDISKFREKEKTQARRMDMEEVRCVYTALTVVRLAKAALSSTQMCHNLCRRSISIEKMRS